jgi:hypothetical protein
LKLIFGAVLIFSWCALAEPKPRWIKGEYQNPALGFAVRVPSGLRGRLTIDQGVYQRGIRIPLRSGGDIVVYGEPNSAEWETPEEGIKSYFSYEECSSRHEQVRPARVGSLSGANGRFVCGNRVVTAFLVFRPGGGPIYWLWLETTKAHEAEDVSVLENVASSLTMITWR